jgi:hypothetical protein
MTDPLPNYVRAVLALVIGPLMCICAALVIQVTAEFMRSSVTTQGHIVRLTYGKHHADAAFQTSSGERIEFPVSSMRSMTVGEVVGVRYDPANPNAGPQVDSLLSIWAFPMLFGSAGIALVLSGARQLWRLRKTA